MTLYQFNFLDELEQSEVLWDKGVMIGDLEDKVYKYILYQIDSFYVELKYHKENNVIQGMKTFASTDAPLKPYLDKLDLDKLL